MLRITWETAHLRLDSNDELALMVRLGTEVERVAGTGGDEHPVTLSYGAQLRISGKKRIDYAMEVFNRLAMAGLVIVVNQDGPDKSIVVHLTTEGEQVLWSEKAEEVPA